MSEYRMIASEKTGENSLCWKQFSLHFFELARWPAVALVIAITLESPVERILAAVAVGLQG